MPRSLPSNVRGLLLHTGSQVTPHSSQARLYNDTPQSFQTMPLQLLEQQALKLRTTNSQALPHKPPSDSTQLLKQRTTSSQAMPHQLSSDSPQLLKRCPTLTSSSLQPHKQCPIPSQCPTTSQAMPLNLSSEAPDTSRNGQGVFKRSSTSP